MNGDAPDGTIPDTANDWELGGADATTAGGGWPPSERAVCVKKKPPRAAQDTAIANEEDALQTGSLHEFVLPLLN